MPEQTFSARARLTLIPEFVGQSRRLEIMDIGLNLLESEELVNLLYQVYLPLLVDGWDSRQDGQTMQNVDIIENIGESYINGFYLPCTKRSVLVGQIDLLNDALPQYAGLATRDKDNQFKFCSVRKHLSNHKFFVPMGGRALIITIFYNSSRASRQDRKFQKGGSSLACQSVPCYVKENGELMLASIPEAGKTASIFGAVASLGAVTINAWADSIFLWNVKTEEALVSKAFSTPIILGVSEEHVKSLFYARSLPVADSGRKRPILHWVRSHQRRIREGIDIDVRKHLRGIELFEMEGFKFAITNPTKAKPAAARSWV